tara:strand:- start:6768 stop:7130 length:363 start_codon:yes stop_codon:yes gene_type:complete
MVKKENEKVIESPQVEEPKEIKLFRNGEMRVYETSSLSQEARRSLAQLELDSRNVMPILNRMVYLAGLGMQVLDQELESKLPEKYEVVKNPDSPIQDLQSKGDTVESKTDKPKENGSIIT